MIDTINYGVPPKVSTVELKEISGKVFFTHTSLDNSFAKTLTVFLEAGERDLQYVDFKCKDLRGVDFKNADIDGADFRWANLEGADLSKTLGKANFYKAKLTNSEEEKDCEHCEGTGVLRDYNEEGEIIISKPCWLCRSVQDEDFSGACGGNDR
jgi:hypothetical protein